MFRLAQAPTDTPPPPDLPDPANLIEALAIPDPETLAARVQQWMQDPTLLVADLQGLLIWAVFVLVWLSIRFALASFRALVVRVVRGKSSPEGNDVRAIIARTVGQTHGFFLLSLSFLLATLVVPVPVAVRNIAEFIVTITGFVQIAIWLTEILLALLARRLKVSSDPRLAVPSGYPLLRFGLQVLIWSITTLLILDNLGVNITALVAGLGVGGIAIGLAAQNVLSDLFASLSIVFDRPFVPGDFIVFGDFMGTVEKTGLKTTRVRSLSGEQIVVSNADLLSSRIRNFKQMYRRRVVFKLGIVYDTPVEKLRKVSALLKEIISVRAGVEFDRAHFASYGDFSLNFEIVFYVLSPDYNKYMDIQQDINLAIFETFAQEGIEFAFPTQTTVVRNKPTSGVPDEALS